MFSQVWIPTVLCRHKTLNSIFPTNPNNQINGIYPFLTNQMYNYVNYGHRSVSCNWNPQKTFIDDFMISEFLFFGVPFLQCFFSTSTYFAHTSSTSTFAKQFIDKSISYMIQKSISNWTIKKAQLAHISPFPFIIYNWEAPNYKL